MFDLGGVLIDLAPLRAFVDRHGITLDDFFAAALGDGAHQRYEQGDLGTDEYVAAFLGEFALELDHADFLADFATWPGALFDGAAELVADVTAAGCVTAALSNSNPVHWDGEFLRHSVRPLFDHAFGSHELGLAKPNPLIYATVADAIGVSVERVVLLDDNQRNVDGAATAGMIARQAVDPASARHALADLGVLPAADA